MAAKSIPGFAAFEDAWDGRAPLGWNVDDPVPVAKTVCALLSRLAAGHHRLDGVGRRRVPCGRGLTRRAAGVRAAVLNRVVLDPVPPAGPVDALLVLSFGGPEGPDEVRPFLENVIRGRGVPPERLDAVEEHYRHFGGVSPLNARNRELIAAIRARMELPVYFGNRNWHPMVEDTVAEMARDGVRRALVFATSAYGGFSACRQYHEDIARARKAVGEQARRSW